MKSKLHKILMAIVLVLSWLLIPIAAQAAPTVTITSPTASATVGTAFAISGTAPASSTITVKINGTTVGTPTADGSGNWTLSVSGQTGGAKTITATLTETNLYAGIFFTSNMMVLDTATNTPIAGSPFDATPAVVGYSDINTAGTRMYTASGSNGPDLFVINLTNNTYETTINIPGSTLGQPILNHDQTKLYVPDSTGNVVHIIDTSSLTVTGTITLSGSMSSPTTTTINDAGTKLYVGGSVIDVVDTTTNTVTNTITPTQSNVYDLQLNHAGTNLYASQTSSPGVIDVIDTTSETVTGTITGLGSNTANALAISPDDTRLYELSGFDVPSNVYVVNTSDNSVITAITVGTLGLGLEFAPNGTLYAVAAGNFGGGFVDGGIWTIDTTNNTATRVYSSDAASTAPAVIGHFIGSQTGSASVSVTVASSSTNTDTLAPTGADQRPATMLVFVLTLVGLVALGYTIQLHKSR